jgi:glycosyltransferase involved in cell wall biosynthesis
MRPEWFSAPAVRQFKQWFEVLSREADQALCISATVSDDLREQLQRSGAPRDVEIGRLRLGGDISASIPSTGVGEEEIHLLRQLESRPTVLMVSTIEPRKGYEVALAAFEHLWQTVPADAPDLIIAGKRGWKTDPLQARLRSHPERSTRLHWLENMSDEALSQFYKACTGVLVTSRAEGFGLPLAEAAMHRKWILVRDLPVFREQALPNVLFFNDERPPALARQVMELTRIASSGEAPAAKLPSWDECVHDLLLEIGLGAPTGVTAA